MKYNELAKKAARSIVVYVLPPALIAGVASQVVPLAPTEVLQALLYMSCGLLAKSIVEDVNKWIA